MKSTLIIDGNSFYEMDTECLKRKELLNKQKNNSSPVKKHTTNDKPAHYSK